MGIGKKEEKGGHWPRNWEKKKLESLKTGGVRTASPKIGKRKNLMSGITGK